VAAPSFASPFVVFVDHVQPTVLLIACSFFGCCTSPSGVIKRPSPGSLCCLAVARFVVGENGSCSGRWKSAPGCCLLGLVTDSSRWFMFFVVCFVWSVAVCLPPAGFSFCRSPTSDVFVCLGTRWI
jgi:hypothetical protein